MDGTERFDTVIVGGGQAGLAVGYHLKKRGRSFVILDGGERVGDSWRGRWDSLRLFTPAKYDGLPGWRFPAKGWSFPTKDEMGDYLEAYADRFDLPVRTRAAVDGLSKVDGRFELTAGGRVFEADNVVVASGAHRIPKVPAFASQLDPGHRAAALERVPEPVPAPRRRRPDRRGGQLGGRDRVRGVAVARRVGVRHARSARSPSDTAGCGARFVIPLLRFAGQHVLTLGTPVGRKVRPAFVSRATPLIRVKMKDLMAAGVEQVPRTASVRDGRPVLEDGRVLDAANVIWSTGFRPEYSWIDLPVFGGDGLPLHRRGVVESEPGLYFIGLAFQYGATSDTLPGVGRDARYVARHIASLPSAEASAAKPSVGAGTGLV